MDKACHYPKMFHVTWFFAQVDGCPWPQDIHAHTKAGVPMPLSLSCPGWQQRLPRVIPCAQETNSALCFVWFSHFSRATNVFFQVAVLQSIAGSNWLIEPHLDDQTNVFSFALISDR